MAFFSYKGRVLLAADDLPVVYIDIRMCGGFQHTFIKAWTDGIRDRHADDTCDIYCDAGTGNLVRGTALTWSLYDFGILGTALAA